MQTPSGRPRAARRWLVAGTLLALLLLAVPAAANLAGSPFDAGDGNLVLDDEAQDWANAPNLKVGLDKPTGQQDDSFGQGTKEDTPVPTVVDGSIPNNKSDLLRFYVANQRVSGKEFLYLAWERVQEPNGTTNMDFEFNQSSDPSGNGVTPVKTPGDVLIKYDLSRGGTQPSLGYHIWTATGPCEAANDAPCWGPLQSLAGNFEGSINGGPVSDPIPPDAPRSLSARTFGEAAINLTDSGILPPGVCKHFGAAYLKSRSSDSFVSELKDFIAPIPVDISNCGTIIIRKQTDPNGAAGSFDYSTTGGLSPASFSLSDDGVRTYSDVISGSYSVTEADPAPGFDFVSLVCSATPGSSATTSGRTVSIELSADGIVDCTYTNRQRGRILIDKVTDPSGDPTSFDFTLTGGPSALNQSFSLTDAAAPHDSGLVVPGAGYSAAETVPVGWDLVSSTCSDGSPIGNIDVGPGETVTCTFTDRARGSLKIVKKDDAGNLLAGAEFTLFQGGTAKGSCVTDVAGTCTISDLVPGVYDLVETITPAGYDPAPTTQVTIVGGQTAEIERVNVRRFTIIVVVCRESDDSLYQSGVTIDGETKQSLAFNGADDALCGTGGARFEGKHVGSHPGNVAIP